MDGQNVRDHFGQSIAGVGDLNLDGYEDYLIGSPGFDGTGQNAGLVVLLSGETSTPLASISGLNPGDQIGHSIAFLGEHDGDGIPKVALGSPYATTALGAFTGITRIYGWDSVANDFTLLDELDGPMVGAMFGATLAAFDEDGDGDLDLAVGAIGANSLDGQVLTFTMTAAGPDLPASGVYDGSLGSGEMFGWAMCATDTSTGAPGTNPGEDLVVGAPFAMDLAVESGAVILIDDAGGMTQLINPFSTIADAHMGYSVAGGGNALGDAMEEIVAGAPDTLLGNVLVWSGSDLSVRRNLSGSAAGDRFGQSVLLIPDANFDLLADLAVGAPGFDGDRGAFYVNEISLAGYLLYSGQGTPGSGDQYGTSLAAIGDINQTTKSEVAVGAALANSRAGMVDVFAPPAEDIGPIEMSLAGSFEWATDAIVTADNLSSGSGGDLYWFVGTNLNGSTHSGFDLDIGGSVSLFAQTISPGTIDSQTYHLEDHMPEGMELFFQVVEDRSGFVRTSDVVSDQVVNPGVSIFVDGNQAPGTVIVSTRWGHYNSPIYLYASPFGYTAQPVNAVPDYNWTINLIAPLYIGSEGQTDMSGGFGDADEGDFTSGPIPVPPAAQGLTVSFQAYDWDLFNPQLTDVVDVLFN